VPKIRGHQLISCPISKCSLLLSNHKSYDEMKHPLISLKRDQLAQSMSVTSLGALAIIYATHEPNATPLHATSCVKHIQMLVTSGVVMGEIGGIALLFLPKQCSGFLYNR